MLRQNAARRSVALALPLAALTGAVAVAVAPLGHGRGIAHAEPLGGRAGAGSDGEGHSGGGAHGGSGPFDEAGAVRVSSTARPAARSTVDPRLDRLARAALAEQGAPLGAVVLVDVRDGRVLALAGRSAAHPDRPAPELATTPWAPAASVFKLVTAAALVDAGVRPDETVCYHGGVHSVEPSNLAPHRRLDRTCRSLAFGLARSQNAILARLAHDHLTPGALGATARALGFGAPLPFDAPAPPSLAAIPDEPLAFARTAAGFWRTTLSPLHGAWMAAAIARGGVAPPLHLAERAPSGDEASAPARGDAEGRRVLSRETAAAVGAMMVGTTRYGTARLGFHDRRGRPRLAGLDVAGKTGTLWGFEDAALTPAPRRDAEHHRFVAYSWFVGYAPADAPEVAIAVLLGNDAPQRARAHQMAARLLAGYFAPRPAASLVARR